MIWITVAWSMIAAACLTLASVHVLIWLKQRAQYAHLLYATFATAVAAFAAFELLMMRAETLEAFRILHRWIHVPVFGIIVSSVWFLYFFFNTGRRWLAISVTGMYGLMLTVNFASGSSMNYLEITGLRWVELWPGATAPVAEAVVNPWSRVEGLTLLLWGAFVADGSLELWRLGGRANRRRAILVGGSLVFLVAVGTLVSQLVHEGILKMPYMMAWLILGPLLAMGYELGSDVLRAKELARQVFDAEQRLREREERLRLALTGARLALWDWDIANNRVFLSDRWNEMLGGAPHSTTATFAELANLVHPEDLPALRQHLRRALKGEVPAYEGDHRVRSLSGDWLWIHSRGEVVVRDGSGWALRMAGINEDITARKLMEEQLRESEQRMALAMNAAEIGMWSWDVLRDEVWVSKQGRALFGWTETEPVNFARFVAALHPGDRERVRHAVERSLAGNGDYEIEFRVVFGNGMTRWMSARGQSEINGEGKAVRMRGATLDVTGRKQAEERFRLVVEASPNAMVMVDRDGGIILFNAQAEKVFGYAREELLGRSIEVLIPERFRSAHSGYRRDYFLDLSARSMGAGRDLYGRRKDGGEIPVEIGLNPIKTSESTFVLASIIDVTERRKIEAEAARQRNELAHLSRVAMLGELSGSLAHELNQPLAAILSNAQAAQRFLVQGTEDIEEVREILKDIVADDKRAGEVIRRLRVLLKKEEAQPHDSLDINEVVLDVLRLVRSDLLNRNVSVHTEFAPAQPMIRGDRIQLQQVLLNLIMNGCDAMDDGTLARSLAVRTQLADAGNIEISVADRGRGIPAQDLERVFEPFVTTKAHGMGLGLAVCRTIVNAHAGRIWATNNAGRGATFHFTLPADPAGHA